jgi:hypothetical protein
MRAWDDVLWKINADKSGKTYYAFLMITFQLCVVVVWLTVQGLDPSRRKTIWGKKPIVSDRKDPEVVVITSDASGYAVTRRFVTRV